MKLLLMEIIRLFISSRKLGFPISDRHFGTCIMSCDIKGKASIYPSALVALKSTVQPQWIHAHNDDSFTALVIRNIQFHFPSQLEATPPLSFRDSYSDALWC